MVFGMWTASNVRGWCDVALPIVLLLVRDKLLHDAVAFAARFGAVSWSLSGIYWFYDQNLLANICFQFKSRKQQEIRSRIFEDARIFSLTAISF